MSRSFKHTPVYKGDKDHSAKKICQSAGSPKWENQTRGS